MKTAGIVAEFDPFHYGHKYLLDKVRERGITHIAAAMSGDLTQRGDVAIFDKQARARCAVRNGADLVIELPCPFSCSCSEIFARAAIKLLAGVGADVLAFGSETDDIALLKECADISQGLTNAPEIAELVKEGLSYPKAVSEYVNAHYGSELSEVFSSPNATLGIEYIKAARQYGIDDFMPIKRRGAAHNSTEIQGGFASASLIRERIRQGLDVSGLTPLETQGLSPAFLDNMEGHMLFTLCQGDTAALTACPDVNEQILMSILHLPRYMPSSLSELFDMLKSKAVTMARLKRIALFLSAGLEAADIGELNAARILAFNKRGSQLLKNAGKSEMLFDTSLARVSEAVPKIVQNIVKGSYFRYLCTDRKDPCINEFTRKIIIEKE